MSFELAELKRKLKNFVRVTSIATPTEGKALATVWLGEEQESKAFPLISFANSFRRHWIPIRADEQVFVVFPFGNANKGYIFRSIFHIGLKEPNGADSETEIVEYEDGTRLSYSTKSHTLKVSGSCSVVIEVENVTVKATSATVDAKSVEVKSSNIVLGGAGAVGVITEKSICPFTKSPHTGGSSITKSK